MIIVFASILVFIFGSAEGIINGNLTTWEENRFLASIITRDNKFICSAAVLSASTLICNADCVANRFAKDYQVRVRSSFSNKGGKVFDIRQFVTYFDFKPSHFLNNFALVHTAEFITFPDPKTATVKLPRILEPMVELPGPKPEMIYSPERTEEPEELTDETELFVAGWGVWKEGSIKFSEQLRIARLVKISNEECSKALNVTLSEPEVFCVKSPDNTQRPSFGDDGAAVFEKSTLYGIVSSGRLTSYDVTKPSIVINMQNYDYVSWVNDFRI